jgi:hypothetical protein
MMPLPLDLFHLTRTSPSDQPMTKSTTWKLVLQKDQCRRYSPGRQGKVGRDSGLWDVDFLWRVFCCLQGFLLILVRWLPTSIAPWTWKKNLREMLPNPPAIPNYKVKRFDEAKEAISLVFKHMPMEKPSKIKLTYGGTLCCASGIGASAAQVISLARAIKQTIPQYSNMTEVEINAAGYKSEKGYHGTPSGIDKTAARTPQVSAYRRGTSL